VKQVLLVVDVWGDMTKGDKKPKGFTFTKHAGLQFNLVPGAEPLDYFRIFFIGELLNNIVTGTDRYTRHNISELQLSQRSIWSMWSDVSVPEVKAFLLVIINIGLIPLPDIKDYWSSDRKIYYFLVT
jgi:hypothetical protein